MSWHAVAAAAVLVVVAGSMVDAARSPLLRGAYTVRPRRRHWVAGVVSVVGTAAVTAALLAVPGMGWSWWRLLGGTGNPVAGSTAALPVAGPVLPWLMLGLFALAAAPMAYAEELLFREGSESRSWWARVGWAAGFGGMHLLVGVPVAAAAGLGVLGWVTTVMYLRGYRARLVAGPADVPAEPGTDREAGSAPEAAQAAREAALAESTATHLVHNYLIWAGLVVVLVTTR